MYQVYIYVSIWYRLRSRYRVRDVILTSIRYHIIVSFIYNNICTTRTKSLGFLLFTTSKQCKRFFVFFFFIGSFVDVFSLGHFSWYSVSVSRTNNLFPRGWRFLEGPSPPAHLGTLSLPRALVSFESIIIVAKKKLGQTTTTTLSITVVSTNITEYVCRIIIYQGMINIMVPVSARLL